MLTKINIKNFKGLKETGELLLDETVIFVGANNSGKTTALQALALWQLGLSKWLEKKSTASPAQKRTGVPINRKDIFAIPVKHNKLMWADLFTHQSKRNEDGKIQETKGVNIVIEVEGITDRIEWQCPLEFEYINEEIIRVRPLKNAVQNTLLTNPDIFKKINVAFLPPMSGLKSNEEKLLPQTIDARIGEGRTAEVLRNICYQVLHPETEKQLEGRIPGEDWSFLSTTIEKLFLIKLHEPKLDSRGEFELNYTDASGNTLEVSSAGRGLQQILLLLSYFLIKPKTVLLFDEPDSHLEVLKQKEVYNLLKAIAAKMQSQIIAASHSEVVLREAAAEDVLIAFYPKAKPHRINDNGKEILKSLRNIGFEDYYLAQQKGVVLYLEGSTDLDILKIFAEKLKHPVLRNLEDCFVHYINQNDPSLAKNHFTGLKDASSELKGIALYDRIANPLNTIPALSETAWKLREVENYFFNIDILKRYAVGKQSSDLFELAESLTREKAMNEAIEDVIPGYARRDLKNSFWKDEKASDWLEKIFEFYFKKLELPIHLRKNKFYHLINFIDSSDLDKEVAEKLDIIYQALKSVMKK